MKIVADVVNWLIDLIVAIALFVIDLLPNTPFEFTPLEWGSFGKMVGLFIPVQSMVTHFAVILSAVGLYYAVRWLLRIIKMVR